MSKNKHIVNADRAAGLMEQFEAAHKSGATPTIEEFLEKATANQREVAFSELLRLDLSYRVAAGQIPAVDDYLRRFPDMESVIRSQLATYRAHRMDGETRDVMPSAADTDGKTMMHPRADGDVTLPPQASPSAATDNEATLSPDGEFDATLPPRTDVDATLPPRADVDATLPPDGSRQRPAADIKIRDFGDYELLQEIARGGMGVVYKARHAKLHRIVALKMILSGQLADEKEVQRFYAEAEAAANLDHPGIVPIYQVGEHEGQHFFSMGFVEGASLQARLNDGPLPPKEAAELTAEIAAAVHHAHQNGVIHRDLKPSNVLLDEAGHPRVTDFGLAKQVQGDSDLTATGQILGTPSYMPPEQASGKLNEINETSDVYSLGGVLYASLTGRPPFQAGNAVDTLMQVLDTEPVNPSQLNAAIPIDLETICLKSLQKEPERRYASAAELLADLNRYLGGEPILARPVGRLEKTWKWCRRNTAVASLLATCAALLLTGTIVSTVFWWQAHQSARIARENELTAKRQEESAKENEAIAHEQSLLAESKQAEAETQRDEADRQKALAQKQLERAEWLLYANQIKLAQMEWNYGDPTIAREALDSCRLSFRGWEHDYLHTEITRNQRTFPGHSNAIDDVVFSPDGKRIVSGSWDDTLKIWNVETGKIIDTLRGHTNDVLSVSFSPDGSRVASCSRDGTIRIWDVQAERRQKGVVSNLFARVSKIFGADESWRLVRTLKGHSGQVYSVGFSPDGKQIASGSRDKTLRVWDVKTGKNTLTVRAQVSISSLAFSPDGTRIVSGSADYTGTTGDVRIWNAMTGENTHILRGHTEAVRSVDFSPDGARIVSASRRRETLRSAGDMRIWDAETGEQIRTLSANTGGVFHVKFSQDGKRIVSGNGDRTIRIWNTDTGRELLTLKGHMRMVLGANFSPDGRQIVSGSWDNTIKVWDVEPRQEASALRGHRQPVRSLAYSHDGKWIASASQDNTVRIWNAETGRQTRVLVGHTGQVRSVSFSPEGHKIVTGSADHTVRIWDTGRGVQNRVLTGHGGGVNCVACSPDGRRIVTGSIGKTIMVWDVETGELVLKMDGHTGVVRDVCFSPDGKLVASGSHDGSAIVWNAETGEQQRELREHDDLVQCVSFSPNGRRLVTGSADKTVKVWDVNSGEAILTLKGHTDAIWDVSFSPNGTRIVSGSYEGKGNPGELKIWDAASGQELLGQNSDGLCLTFSPDGKRILSGGVDGTIRIWDASHHQDSHTLKAHRNGVQSVRFSPDGKRIASAGRDETIKIWDADTGAEILILEGHLRDVRSVSFSPDGTQVASAGGNNIIVWDAATGRMRHTLHGHSRIVFSVSYSSDGKWIVSGSGDNEIKVWDAESGTEAMTLAGHSGLVRCARFSPDGSQIVSAGADKLIKLWDVNSGQETKSLEGHESRVLSVSFSPDGKRIVSAGEDQAIRIWDAETGDEELTLVGHSGPVRNVEFSADGNRVVSGSIDKTIKVWDATTGTEILTLADHTDAVHDVQFSPDGSSLVSGSNDATVRMWKLPDPAELASAETGSKAGPTDEVVSSDSDVESPGGKPEPTAANSGFAMPTTSMIYWTDRHVRGICRMNLDGSDAQSILWDLGEPRGLLLHNDTELYYCDYELDRIGRTDLVGASPQLVIAAAPGVRGITIDDRSNKIYWTDRELKKTYRANLDGTDVEELMSDGLVYPYAIQLDPVADKLYVEDHGAGIIFRSNLDGSERETFVTVRPQSHAGGMVFDVEGRRLYYKDGSGLRIMRIGLEDGDEAELVFSGSNDVLGLTIDEKNKKLYWADTAIRRSNLDGTQIETVLESTFGTVKSIVIYHPPADD